jgi:hypothetical protein
MPTTTIHPVRPTTQVELAEEHLAHDLTDLTDALLSESDPLAVRRAETHVALAERRVRSLRALPHHRCATSAEDARQTLAVAYAALGRAYDRAGARERAMLVAGRAAAEREALAVAA